MSYVEKHLMPGREHRLSGISSLGSVSSADPVVHCGSLALHRVLLLRQRCYGRCLRADFRRAHLSCDRPAHGRPCVRGVADFGVCRYE